MIEKSWDDFFQRLDELEFEGFDLIVAIARGGIIPAAFIQQKINIPMKVIQINYRDDSHKPRYDDAKLLEAESFNVDGKKILLVDDVSRTGKTLDVAKKYLNDSKSNVEKANEIKTCIVNGDGDYYFFKTDSCLKMPWKR